MKSTAVARWFAARARRRGLAMSAGLRHRRPADTYNHPEPAAAILKPFVSEANLLLVQMHGVVQGYDVPSRYRRNW